MSHISEVFYHIILTTKIALSRSHCINSIFSHHVPPQFNLHFSPRRLIIKLIAKSFNLNFLLCNLITYVKHITIFFFLLTYLLKYGLTFLTFIYVVGGGRFQFFHNSEVFSLCTYMYVLYNACILHLHSSIIGHLVCFQISVIIKSAATQFVYLN